MLFLNILLLILKIIGIIILAVLLLVIGLLSIVLFVPIHYESQYEYYENLNGFCNVNWLFKTFAFNLKTVDGETDYDIKMPSWIDKLLSDDNEEEKSIYSIAEIDKENTKDSKNPEYKLTKYYGEALNFDSKSSLSQIGTNLDEEVAIVGLVKFKEDDIEKIDINLDSYKDEVGNYSEVNIFKIKVSK